jgi:transcriptional regulator with XRE-family HTH domain
MPRPSKTKTHCRTVRLNLGLTQAQLAQALLVSTSMVNRVECGQIYPGRLMREKLRVIENPKLIDSYMADYQMEFEQAVGYAHHNARKSAH